MFTVCPVTFESTGKNLTDYQIPSTTQNAPEVPLLLALFLEGSGDSVNFQDIAQINGWEHRFCKHPAYSWILAELPSVVLTEGPSFFHIASPF